MFEIALNKCTVLLSTAGLEENIPTIEALIWAQGATAAAAAAAALGGCCRRPVDQHPLLVDMDTAAALGPQEGKEKVATTEFSLLTEVLNLVGMTQRF